MVDSINIDANSLAALRISNFQLITEGVKVIGTRGQTLSAHKKRWALTK